MKNYYICYKLFGQILTNRRRDKEINIRLLFEGWIVKWFWGNDTKICMNGCVKGFYKTIFGMTLDRKEVFTIEGNWE